MRSGDGGMSAAGPAVAPAKLPRDAEGPTPRSGDADWYAGTAPGEGQRRRGRLEGEDAAASAPSRGSFRQRPFPDSPRAMPYAALSCILPETIYEFAVIRETDPLYDIFFSSLVLLHIFEG